MNYYLDIQLLPSSDFSVQILMNTLYVKFHRALVAQKRFDIGVSFPDPEKTPLTLGALFRLHSNQISLQQFMDSNWLVGGMRDYVAYDRISEVPSAKNAWAVRRLQAKSSPARERARLIRRKNISEKDAFLLIPDTSAKKLSLPFVVLYSQSTGQKFRLFISQKACQMLVDGKFNSYGLSDVATVPKF